VLHHFCFFCFCKPSPLCKALTLGVLGSRLLDTMSTGACNRGASGGGGGAQLDDASAQWVSCPRTPQAGIPTCRAVLEGTYRSRG
jgi:hypothetical protein